MSNAKKFQHLTRGTTAKQLKGKDKILAPESPTLDSFMEAEDFHTPPRPPTKSRAMAVRDETKINIPPTTYRIRGDPTADRYFRLLNSPSVMIRGCAPFSESEISKRGLAYRRIYPPVIVSEHPSREFPLYVTSSINKSPNYEKSKYSFSVGECQNSVPLICGFLDALSRKMFASLTGGEGLPLPQNYEAPSAFDLFTRQSNILAGDLAIKVDPQFAPTIWYRHDRSSKHWSSIDHSLIREGLQVDAIALRVSGGFASVNDDGTSYGKLCVSIHTIYLSSPAEVCYDVPEADYEDPTDDALAI